MNSADAEKVQIWMVGGQQDCECVLNRSAGMVWY